MKSFARWILFIVFITEIRAIRRNIYDYNNDNYYKSLPQQQSRLLSENRTKCPKVKALRNFNLNEMVGKWYVIQYYASSEEALPYRCMRVDFRAAPFLQSEVTMDLSFSFTDDPLNEQLVGNITWRVPNLDEPAHWTHSEHSYEGVYNTYILDSDYKTWVLMLHCAEKSKVPRYLSSFLMSRTQDLGVNVISYLRDKLRRYDVDLHYMFPVIQNECNPTAKQTPFEERAFHRLTTGEQDTSNVSVQQPQLQQYQVVDNEEE